MPGRKRMQQELGNVNLVFNVLKTTKPNRYHTLHGQTCKNVGEHSRTTVEPYGNLMCVRVTPAVEQGKFSFSVRCLLGFY